MIKESKRKRRHHFDALKDLQLSGAQIQLFESKLAQNRDDSEKIINTDLFGNRSCRSLQLVIVEDSIGWCIIPHDPSKGKHVCG